MNFYIVMQGRSFADEKAYSIISAYKSEKSGQLQHFWERMKEVQEGDAIFHVVKGDIVAISTARGGYQEGTKPYEETEDLAYIVPTTYEELEKPLNVKSHWSQLQNLMPIKYSAFQQNGDGNQGYLYPCNEQLAIQLLNLISDSNVYNEELEQLEFVMGPIIENAHDSLATVLMLLEAKAHAKLRKCQHQHEASLAPLWNYQCALCGIALSTALRATYAKPWKDSTDAERVDPHNGLLLCCNHQALYVDGYIAFDGTGLIHIATQLSEENYTKFALHPKMKVARNEFNKPYFKWHKRHIFRGE